MLAPDQELVYGANGTLAFAPDGGSLVFSGRMKGRAQLFRRSLTAREAVPIAGTEDGDSAFFSPDGQWIGFVAGGNIMKVAAEGGRPFRLAGQLGVGGSAWLRDGTIVFNAVYSDGLFQVSTEGGTPKRLTTPDRAAGELGHWWPDPLPDARHIVFTAFRTPVDESRIGVLDLCDRQCEVGRRSRLLRAVRPDWPSPLCARAKAVRGPLRCGDGDHQRPRGRGRGRLVRLADECGTARSRCRVAECSPMSPSHLATRCGSWCGSTAPAARPRRPPNAAASCR